MTITPLITPLFGTSRDDALYGTHRSEIASGRGGDDTIYANSGSDIAYGGSGDDYIAGGRGDDVLYGGGGPSYAANGPLTIAEDYTGRVTFLNEGAGFRNTLGMYRVDETGTITGVEILFANASALHSGGSLIRGESHVDVELNAGDRVGFFVASNAYGRNGSALETGAYVIRDAAGNPATLETTGQTTLFRVAEDGSETAVRTQYGTSLFHSAADPSNGYGLNPDSYPHTVGRIEAETGTVILGFEDLWRGGDKDYDDVVLSFDVGQSNARVLDPNLAYGEGGRDWTYGEDGGRYDADGNRLKSENDELDGGTGNDKVYGMAGHDDLSGGDGDDLIKGNSGDDTVSGDAGNDTLSGGKGDDELHGGSGADILDGNSGDDFIFGGSGDDVLKGSSGADALSGDSGDDQLDGGSGDDVLSGGEGNDALRGGTGDDQLAGGSGSDVLDGAKGNDVLLGDGGSDRLKGGSGNDTLSGGEGKDHLNGGSGDDLLNGGAGSDRVYLGAGDDIAFGGADSDRFVFRSEDLDGATDRIADFRHDAVEQDILDFRALSLLGDQSGADWMALNAAFDGNGDLGLDLGECTLVIEDHREIGEALYAEVFDSILFA